MWLSQYYVILESLVICVLCLRGCLNQNKPDIQTLEDELVKHQSPLITVCNHFSPLELRLYQQSCHEDGSPALYLMWVSLTVLFTGKDLKQTCQKNVCFDTETPPETVSPAAQSLGMKNETAIIVITGLRNNILKKKEKFWQLSQREYQILKKKKNTVIGDKQMERQGEREAGWLSLMS